MQTARDAVEAAHRGRERGGERARDGKLITELSLLIAIPAICAMAWRCSVRARLSSRAELLDVDVTRCRRRSRSPPPPRRAPRCGTALCDVIAGTNYAISAAL